jgi:hypothetical protein
MAPARALALLIVLLVLPFAGCVDALDGAVDRVRGTPPPPADLAVTLQGNVGPGYERAHAFPVESGARSLHVAIALTFDAPLPVPVTPVDVTFTLLDPAGGPVGDAVTLNPLTTEGVIEVTRFPAFGTYELLVEGHGLSDGDQGARYDADVTVTYRAVT